MGRPLYRDEQEKVRLEARNGLLLDEVIRLVDDSGSDLCLSLGVIKRLHELAIKGIYRSAGEFREWPVKIGGSTHMPPEARYVEEMCGQANGNTDWSPVKTAAYLM